MISFLRKWCEGIIVAVVISIIIETLLPEGNNKKYAKIIIGIYIIFTILNPILGKIENEINFKMPSNLASIETSAMDFSNMKKVYVNGIEEIIKINIKEKYEYDAKKIEISFDKNYENIEKIKIKLSNKKVDSNTLENEIIEMKRYISKEFDVLMENIIID